MNHGFLLCILIHALCVTGAAQQPKAIEEVQGTSEADDQVELRFELTSSAVPEGESVYIAGSVAELGNWQPGKVKMVAAGPNRWTHSIKVKRGWSVEYKYTLGSWAREAANARGKPLANLVVDADSSKSIKDQVAFWTTSKARSFSGGVTGEIRFHRQLEFPGLLPRDVAVWLPPDYESSGVRYGVLYMHDGQNLFDPATSSFGVDWQIDESLTRLAKSGDSAPMICVGIFNTKQRSKDYLPGDQNDKYIEFICSKLKPLIDRSYRTKTERESTAIGGSSNGGICAFRCAWERPKIFSRAICFSPAFKYSRQNGELVVDYVSTVGESKLPDPMPKFFIANGGVGLEKQLQPGIDEMLELLSNKGLKQGEQFIWKKYPSDRHEEAAWARQFADTLKWLGEK